jgi:CHAD domain-containing protein/transposase
MLHQNNHAMQQLSARIMDLTSEQRTALELILQNTQKSDEHRRNARLLIAYADGRETKDIAPEAGLSESRTRYWRKVFEQHGMNMFAEGFTARSKRSAKSESAHAAHGSLLSDEQGVQLRKLLQGELSDEVRRRIHLVLQYSAGKTTNEIATEVGLSESRTRYWRKAFERNGMSIFSLEHTAPETKAAAPPPHPESVARKKTPGLVGSDSFPEAGRKILHLHFHEMLQHGQSNGLGNDPEIVHRMRVATRRMRSAFDIFRDAFNAKHSSKYRKPLKNVGRALGRVRDLDVLLMHMHQYAESLPAAEAAAFHPLIEEWEKERRVRFEALLNHLQTDEYRAFCDTFEVFVNSEGKGSAAEPIVIDGVPKRIGQIAPVLIMERYTDILSFDASLETATLDQLHMLRIQFKKLRYTLEYFVDLLGPQARKVIRHVTDVQDYLGELQDDQTAGEIVTAFIHDLDMQQTTLPLMERLNSAPLLTYLAERQARKHALLTSFGDTWAQFTSREFRKKLLRALLNL